jgi:ADP-ribosyl-[dinitrogen reductase] hydrolase
MATLLDKLSGSLVGLAVGDAVGTTVEFKPRGSFPTVTDMTGGGPFRLPVGYWTDDTSMAVCLAESLLFHPSLDKNDLLDRFCKWYKEGYNSPTGRCFDIGITTCNALEEYMHSGSVVNNNYASSAGNGSIMRLAPVAILYHADPALAADCAVDQGMTTHASNLASGCCEMLSDVLTTLYTATDPNAIFDIKIQDHWPTEVKNILNADLLTKTEKEIQSTGYAVHTLEAAVWCFLTTKNFEQAVLKAVNLGGDADTIGAVTGQIAGAYYGESDIPDTWIEKLYDYNRIKQLAIELAKKGGAVSGH